MKKYIPALALVVGISVAGIHTVSAANPSTTTQIIAKSDTAIAARITALNKLSARMATFKHLSDTQRASITASIQSSITAMNTLKAKIDAETDLALLKADAASITKDYRIYAVVLPDEASIAATDNAMATIATYRTTLDTLQARITTAHTAGKDTSAIQASYDNASTKLADAQSQSTTLVAAATALKVDNGDKTIQANNKLHVTAAKTARKAMMADLATAKKDIASIRTGLK